jgi:signal transduction histidine kinase
MRFGKDFTDFVRASELTPPRDREKREHELQQANDFHSVLLAMAGHDLRQPLQAIKSAREWLARRLDTGSEREYLRRANLRSRG